MSAVHDRVSKNYSQLCFQGNGVKTNAPVSPSGQERWDSGHCFRLTAKHSFGIIYKLWIISTKWSIQQTKEFLAH